MDKCQLEKETILEPSSEVPIADCKKCQIPENTLPSYPMMFREQHNSEIGHVRYVHDMLCASNLSTTGHDCKVSKQQPLILA
eukprot:1086753-Pelagomonas_calceolata.AAC.1